jgi:hypothetical protein
MVLLTRTVNQNQPRRKIDGSIVYFVIRFLCAPWKGAFNQLVKVQPGKLSFPVGNNRGGRVGNETVEASGVEGHLVTR